MRVAMLSYHTCPLATLGGKDTGGMNVYVKELTRRLGEVGVHVDVFTRSQDEHVPHVLHDLGYGNRVVHIPAGPEVPLPRHELHHHVPAFVEGIRDFTSRKGLGYDLIHSHYWLSGIAALALQSDWSTPVVHMFHTLGKMKRRVAREGEHELDERVHTEQRLLEGVDRIVVATPAGMAQLQWLYRADPEKISVIPPGVDLSHFYPIPPDEAKEYVGVPQEDQMLLFVGRIEPLKGIDTLIKAVEILLRAGVLERHKLCLTIIGGDPAVDESGISDEMTRLKALSQQHGLEGLITFAGRRSQDSLPYYYSAATLVVMPSHYESFGMVALEAMACGTPVVASQVGGLAFLVEDGGTGYLVPDQDPEALADRLLTLLEDPVLRQRMGARGRVHAQGYGWEVIARRIVALYESLLGRGRGTFPERTS